MKIFHFKKSIFLIPLLGLLLFLVPSSAFAVGEICADNATCCTPPQSIIDGGGCSSGKYWIGPALGGRCQTNTTTCGATQFSCISGACTGSSTGTAPICNSTQVHIGNNVCKPKLDIYEDSASVYKMWKGEVLGDPIYMNPSGKVGIGTITPGAKLDVRGSTVKFATADDKAHTWFPFTDGEVYITGNVDGNGDGDIHLRSFTGSTYTDRMIVEGNTGNVRIGTTSPLDFAKLYVTTNYVDYDAKAIYGVTTAWGYGIEGKSNNSAGVVGISGTGMTPADHGEDDKIGVFADGEDFGFYSGASKDYFAGKVGIGTKTPGAKLEVAGDIKTTTNLFVNGNVGIGTDTPSYKLHVNGDAYMNNLNIGNGSNGNLLIDSNSDCSLINGNWVCITSNPKPLEVKIDGSTAFRVSGRSNTDVFGTLKVHDRVLMDAGGDIDFGGDDNTLYESSGDMFMKSADDVYVQANGDDIFLTAKDDVHLTGGGGGYVDVTVNSSGNLGVGTSISGSAINILRSDETNAGLWISNWTNSADHSYDPYITFDSSLAIFGKISMYDTGTIMFQTSDDLGSTWSNTAYISAAGNIKAYGSFTTSDERLKKNIEPISDSLDKIMNLRGISFKWKDTGRGDDVHLGLIAQEVLPVVPELVKTDEDLNEIEFYNLDYNGFIPLLIESVKELKIENDSLKKRLDELEVKE